MRHLRNLVMVENLVEISGMSFQHENGTAVFKDIDIIIPRGKITAIMGPSGTGKTTLLRLIGGQFAPNKGRVMVEGQCIHRLSRKKLYQRRKDGYALSNGGPFYPSQCV